MGCRPESVVFDFRADQTGLAVVGAEIKYNTFRTASHQAVLKTPTASTNSIYQQALALFDELWDQTPIRLLGIRTSKLVPDDEPVQLNLFDYNAPLTEKQQKLDAALDSIRNKFG